MKIEIFPFDKNSKVKVPRKDGCLWLHLLIDGEKREQKEIKKWNCG
jgi:hypothetical protein